MQGPDQPGPDPIIPARSHSASTFCRNIMRTLLAVSISLSDNPSDSVLTSRVVDIVGRIECRPARIGQNDKLRAAVMRIGSKSDKPVLCQIVDNALNILPVGAEIARQPGNGLRVLRGNNRPQNLPAGARQSKPGDQPVTPCQHLVVRPEQMEEQIGHRLACLMSWDIGHFVTIV